MLEIAEYKKEFIDFLIKIGALKIGSDWTLKSGRMSPYFVNLGDFSDGESIAKLSRAYAELIKSTCVEFDSLYGIPEKGVGLAIATSIGLASLGINKGWFFTRKEAKLHGEGTNVSKEEIKKSMIVGKVPKDGDRIIQLDDVFTAGDAKYEARKTLKTFGDFALPLLAIAVDREEIGIDGQSAIEKYVTDTETNVNAIITATEIYTHLKSKGEFDPKAIERILTYLRVYGTKKAKEYLEIKPLEQRVIESDRSIIVACDVPTLEDFEDLVKNTADVRGIGGYKLGFELGLGYALPKVVEVARKHTNKPLIYDHQKAGSDIPDTGKNFARVCKDSGIDTVIFFPQAGPETERAWIYHALDQGLKVIVGGRMTHKAYTVSEGGFITDEGAMEMYRISARAGVNNFVVPGNKPEVIRAIKEVIESEGINPTFYAPGFVAQGGKISDATQVTGDKWHAIVGRGIYEAKDRKTAALEHASQI